MITTLPVICCFVAVFLPRSCNGAIRTSYRLPHIGNRAFDGPSAQPEMVLTRGQYTHFFEKKSGTGNRNGLMNASYRWPGAVIVYYIAPTFSERDRQIILSAMMHIQERTCVRFRRRNAYDQNYAYIQGGAGKFVVTTHWAPIMLNLVISAESSPGCSSNVGYIRSGRQSVTLGQGCVDKAVIVHELMHTIGFLHEQNRPDRDVFVKINWWNIFAGQKSQFEKARYEDVYHFGGGYDYLSVMHYDKHAFAINPSRATIEAVGSFSYYQDFGSRTGLSTTDALKINNMYRCYDKK